ncbi:putative dehydrogenase [Antricoccus suffuscus]|uniref:Putative dehydrogenase n=1 Tax=Antricoccus suffuscus TaxID=1629062 RepID=A0A2T1A135_9ACTN|nr:Gfo/Idh/MocA family oxidoreductase [Antricoccus suffuscus]PRZ42320.1 putative dehydrogenase [Antricoccus suffuscus]
MLETRVMRVALVGVSHWHLSLYLPELVRVPGAEIVGVSDDRLSSAESIAGQIGCAAYASYEQMCGDLHPDFVLALGEHYRMAALGNYLADQRIAFAMEKPCGVSSIEVEELARNCSEHDVFAAVPFVWRQSELLAEMRKRFADEEVSYMSLRWIAGPPSRYVDSDCAWMLDPQRSGGGCTINLGVHLLDFARFIFGAGTSVASAAMSNAAYGLGIEDYSLVALRCGSRRAVAETGYLFPGPHSSFDMHFTIKTEHSYLVATGPNRLLVYDDSGSRTDLAVMTTNVSHYPLFVRDVLDRVRTGRAPVATMDDMAAAMRLVEDAYSAAGAIT